MARLARAHARARRRAYVHLIVNEGTEAGASLPHTHAQLYALPFVPAPIARERERFTAYSDRTQGRNLLEDLVQEEVKRGERVVAVDDEAVALCPFAARVPFHVQLVPRRPGARFEDDGAARRRAAARGARAGCAPCSAPCRRSTCGCAPPRATPSTSAGGSRCCRASRSSPGWSSAPACT